MKNIKITILVILRPIDQRARSEGEFIAKVVGFRSRRKRPGFMSHMIGEELTDSLTPDHSSA